MDACQQGESVVSKHPDIMFISNQTPNRGWPNNVCCDAAQICPTPGFEHVCAVCCCVWGPPCVNAACANIVFCFKSPLCGGLVPVAACFPVASACFLILCLLQCRVCFAAVGCSGLVKATKLVHRQRLPTPPGVYHIYFSIQCIDISLGHTHFSPSSLWCTHPGFLRDTPSIPQFSLAHPPWGSKPRPRGSGPCALPTELGGL